MNKESARSILIGYAAIAVAWIVSEVLFELIAFGTGPQEALLKGLFFAIAAGVVMNRVLLAMLKQRQGVENSLRQSEMALARAQAVGRSGSWEMDVTSDTGLIHGPVRWSAQLFRLFNRKIEAGTPTNEEFPALIHPDDRQRVAAALRRITQSGTPYSIDYRSNPERGAIQHLRSNVQAVFGDDGKITTIVGTVQDVTEQHLAEDALRRSEAALALAQKVANLGSWELDPGMQQGSWSAQMYALLERDPVLGAPTFEAFLEQVIPEDRQKIIDAFAGIGETGEACQFEFRIRSRDDSLRELRSNVEAIRDENGRVAKFVGTTQDVTVQNRIQAELAERERAFASLLANMQGFVYRCGPAPNWDIEFVSQGIIDISAHAASEFVAKTLTWRSMIHPDDREAVRAALRGAFQARRGYQLEYRIIGGDNHERWVVDRGSGQYAPDGSLSIWEGTVYDITPQKKAEGAFRASEMRLRSLFDQAPVGIFILTPDLRVIDANVHGEQMLGYDREELLRKRVPELVASHSRDLTDTLIGRVIERKEQRGEWQLLRKDGSTLAVEWRARRISDEQYLVTLQDLTPQRDAALRLEMALRYGNVGLWDRDIRTNKVFYSSEWKRQLGYEENEIDDNYTDWESRIHPEDRERTLAARQAFREGRTPDLGVEFRMRHKDGTYRSIISRGGVIRDEQGNPTRALGVHVDITDRKRIEEQLAQTQKMEAIGKFTGGMAHDFNNYLAVVIANLEMIKENTTSDPLLRKLADLALAGAVRGAELTRTLLTFSRSHPVEPRATDVSQSIAAATRLLGRVLGEDVAIEVSAAPDLWPAMIDGSQLEASIVNLANNARDAMPRGGKLLISAFNEHIEATPGADDREIATGDWIVVSVTDTGAGMSPEILARVFEPFFSTKPTGHGTGLGLSMVYGFAKQSKGHVRIDSAVGSGTTVRLYLPRAVETRAPTTGTAAPASVAKGGETVLLVDDNADVRQTLAIQLERFGYRVVEADSGDAALVILERGEQAIDLVLSDIVMPGKLRGDELADHVGKRWPTLKVVLITGYAGDGRSPETSTNPPRPILLKPYNQADLAYTLRRTLDG